MSTNVFTISGLHIEVTPALEAYAEDKLSKILKIFAKRITTIHVVLSVDKYMQTAEAEVKIAGDQNSIFAKVTSDDMYKSIDQLEKKLLTQVKKYHDKLVKKHEQ